MTEDSQNHGGNPEFDPSLAVLENRLRADLPNLAEALLVAEEYTGHAAGPGPDRGQQRPEGGRRLGLVAAAAAALLVGASVLWATINSDSEQIEAALNDDDVADTVDSTLIPGSGWLALSEVAAERRAHMVSVWTGEEAVFWGGRTELGEIIEAYVGGVAYNPQTGAWRDIAAPDWAHPGAHGVYADGWLYVTAKGRVTRFDPLTGEEQEIDLPAKFGGAVDIVGEDGRVWIIGVLNRGPVAIPVDPVSGQLSDDEEVSSAPWPFGWETPDGSSDRMVVHNGDLYVVSSGSIIRVPGVTGEPVELAGPENVPEPRGLRVFSGDSELGFVSAGPDFINVGRLAEDGVVEWGEDQIPVESGAGAATVVAAGDWLTVLPNGDTPVSVHLATGDQITHSDSPLAGYANANAVWTGTELVVWGGQRKGTVDGGAPGARWIPPTVIEEEAMEVGPEPTPVDGEADGSDSGQADAADGDVQDIANLEEALAALPLRQRFNDQDVKSGIFTFDGTWVYSRPDVEAGNPLRDHGEILLLDGFNGPIINSWVVPMGPPGTLVMGDDAVYCLRSGDGGLPDDIICRIDLETGEMTARVWPAEEVSSAYTDRGWTVEQPWFNDPLVDHPDWSSMAWSERGLVVGGPGRWGLLDLDDLSTISITEVDGEEPVTACPLLGAAYTLAEQPDLPEPVTATRQEVFDAAMSCDFDRLIELGVYTSTSFGGGTFAQNVGLEATGGGDDLVYLVRLLSLPHTTEEYEFDGQSETTYWWPSAFVDGSEDGSGIGPEELAALIDIYGPTFLDDLQEFGGYIQHRIGINSDGTWTFFIAGD